LKLCAGSLPDGSRNNGRREVTVLAIWARRFAAVSLRRHPDVKRTSLVPAQV
jgi:hypothetical protein